MPLQLCTRPDVDNHWALRDFASRLMANICKNFNSSTNSVQTRVTRVFSEAMRTERNPLVCYYGAIAGLQVRMRGTEIIASSDTCYRDTVRRLLFTVSLSNTRVAEMQGYSDTGKIQMFTWTLTASKACQHKWSVAGSTVGLRFG